MRGGRKNKREKVGKKQEKRNNEGWKEVKITKEIKTENM